MATSPSPPPVHFAVLPLKYNNNNPLYFTRIGNIIYLVASPDLPSKVLETLESNEHPLDRLEKGLQILRDTAETRVRDLKAKRKQGQQLTDEEEDYLDYGGNMIEEQMLVDDLLALIDNTWFKIPSVQSYNTFERLAEAYQQDEEYQLLKKAQKNKKANTSSTGARQNSTPATIRLYEDKIYYLYFSRIIYI
ncbi:hypothetical protein DFH28DRAFT_930838 [Melampsora americana]|nr:hypothetical protein DFH28DRAFT_930838 [Melampsora americana]